MEGESYDHGSDEGNYAPTGSFSSLPTTGPLPNAQNLWYDPVSEGIQSMNTADSATPANTAELVDDGNEAVAAQPGENAVGSPLTDMGALQSALSEVSGEADK